MVNRRIAWNKNLKGYTNNGSFKKDSIPLIGRKGKRFIDLRKENNFNSLVRKFTNANYAVN